ncbi:MAG: hypothetical protein JXC32_12485, partial [Anaerolineae bacterium]|nr:hypothetical protein [Anaerolineae bacterium]
MIELTEPKPSQFAGAGAVRRKRSGVATFLRNIYINRLIIFLALPGIVLIFLLKYIPMFGIVVAFEDFRADTGFLSPWVGLDNFRLLFGSPVLWRIVRNTISLNVLFLIATTIFSVGMALMLNELAHPIFKKLTQSIMYLPFFMSWTVVAMLLYGFFDFESGMINSVL